MCCPKIESSYSRVPIKKISGTEKWEKNETICNYIYVDCIYGVG